MNFKKLADDYKTPLYVYNFDYMRDRFEELKSAFSGRKSLICYAVKANSNLSVIKHFADMGSGCDCVSIGEVNRAFKAGVSKYKIIFSGVGKADHEIKEALEKDILLINLESEAELLRVEMIAKELNLKARISVRVNPNIDPQTHPYISTGMHENKFGVEIDRHEGGQRGTTLAQKARPDLGVKKMSGYGLAGEVQDLKVLTASVHDAQPISVQHPGEGSQIDDQGIDQDDHVVPGQLD